ncbi:MAG: hypothetical protein R3F49_03555 [Planctomycetota bacterium]
MRNPLDAWRAARTFDELCALGARFVRGALEAFPGWGAPDLDEESDTIHETLVHCMDGGLLTTASQPGRPFAPGHDGRAWGQRAFLCGFARDATLARLRGAADEAGLWCSAPRRGPATAVPVGLADGTPYLFAGHDAYADELELFEDALDPRAHAELAATQFIWLVDPVWGRREALPRAVAGALPGGAPAL